jgi:putative transcriptional regulator
MKTRIPELRARYGLTQAQLAQAVGVQRETIVHLERGRYNPSLRLAYKISRALRSTVEDVFSFDDEEA